VVVRITFSCHNFQQYFVVVLGFSSGCSWFQWCFKGGKEYLAARSTEMYIYLQLIGLSTPFRCIKYKDLVRG